jgi:hypothetical protein
MLMVSTAMALVSTACGGGGASPQDYFSGLADEMQLYDDTISEARDNYGTELEEELTALQENADLTDTASVDAYFDQAKEVAIVKTADLFTDTGSALRQLIDSLEAMEPPNGLQPAHQDLVAAGEALAATMPLTIEGVRSLDSIEDLQESIDSSPFTVAAQRFGIACKNLEAAANGAGIEVDLNCPDGIEGSAE